MVKPTKWAQIPGTSQGIPSDITLPVFIPKGGATILGFTGQSGESGYGTSFYLTGSSPHTGGGEALFFSR
jgi:hypothetical protein